MSAQMNNSKNKTIAAVVLVLLAVVVVVNVVVFKPGQKGPGPSKVRLQASQPMPVELGDYRFANEIPNEDLAAWTTSAAPRLRRDPFGSRQLSGTIVEEETAVEPVAEEQPLECNAILLGGNRLVAMISGDSYRVGDRVDQYVVTVIGTTGVKLKSDSGSELFLSVHAASHDARLGRVITGSTMKNGLGITSLVEHARGERN